MSKLRCDCGHVIRDDTDFIKYKASLVRDQDSVFKDKLLDHINSFMNADKAGKRNKWIIDFFGDSFFLKDANDSILYLIYTRIMMPYESVVYQCENCGRVLIESNKVENCYNSFVMEDENTKDIFLSNLQIDRL